MARGGDNSVIGIGHKNGPVIAAQPVAKRVLGLVPQQPVDNVAVTAMMVGGKGKKNVCGVRILAAPRSANHLIASVIRLAKPFQHSRQAMS